MAVHVQRKVIEKASAPLAVATTLLPKRPLSYRWTIKDAKDFLLIKLGSPGLKSPTFPITVPLRTESAGLQEKVLWWYLTVVYSRSYTVEVPPPKYSCVYSAGLKNTVTTTKGEYSLSVSFWQDKDRNETVIAEHQSDIHISDCTFSVINHNSEEVLYMQPVQSFRCAINKTDSGSAIKSVSFKKVSDLGNYLCNDTLTIQVNATLNFFMDPMETSNTYTQCTDDIKTGMQKLLSDGLLSDLTIKCGEEEFKVHKAVLASQSPAVFKKMLESDMKEQRTNVIEISDVDQTVISDMLAYIYTGSAPNLDTLARELLNVANKYKLSGLFTMCERELKSKISLNNVIELLQLADMLDSSYLKKACLNYISINSGAVRSSEEWKQLKENSEENVSLLMDIMDCLLKC